MVHTLQGARRDCHMSRVPLGVSRRSSQGAGDWRACALLGVRRYHRHRWRDSAGIGDSIGDASCPGLRRGGVARDACCRVADADTCRSAADADAGSRATDADTRCSRCGYRSYRRRHAARCHTGHRDACNAGIWNAGA